MIRLAVKTKNESEIYLYHPASQRSQTIIQTIGNRLLVLHHSFSQLNLCLLHKCLCLFRATSKLTQQLDYTFRRTRRTFLPN